MIVMAMTSTTCVPNGFSWFLSSRSRKFKSKETSLLKRCGARVVRKEIGSCTTPLGQQQQHSQFWISKRIRWKSFVASSSQTPQTQSQKQNQSLQAVASGGGGGGAGGGAGVESRFSAMNLAAGAVNALFQYQPFFRFAAGRARKMIIERGAEIGHPWSPTLAQLRAHDWEQEMQQARNSYVQYPDYYLKPFHAYEDGNLSWDAALEVELAAKSVHATTFDPQRKKLDPEGDVRLRQSYHSTMMPMLKSTPHAIVDMGCSTGLSTFGLREIFPAALTVGVDLSPYFISVANYQLRERDKRNSVQFLHAAAEYTGLPSGAYDLVSLCLLCHELPRSATMEIIQEAHRLLKVGGALAIMEMDPSSVHVQNMVQNVFAFTAFKATEPYFDDYRTFPIEAAIAERGFTRPVQTPCSPRHRTIVAHKK